MALLALLAVMAAAAVANADLASDTTRLREAWAARARVHRAPPRLVERGSLQPIPLPLASTVPRRGRCLTVALLGVRESSFVVHVLAPSRPGQWGVPAHSQSSVGGAVELVRCGPARSELGRLAVEMRSPRGVLELLVAQSARPLPSLRQTLPHRDPGPNREPPSVGPLPPAPPLATRAEGITRQSRREGATEVSRTRLRSGETGAGATLLSVSTGCHRFDLLGPPTPGGSSRSVDIDAAVWLPPATAPVATDRRSSPDATLRVCVGQNRTLGLRYVGAAPRARLLLLDSHWPLFEGIPAHWDPRGRALIAAALLRQRARPLTHPPAYASLGVTGRTVLPIEVLPNACYVAAAAAFQGQATSVAVSVDVGDTGGPTQRSTDEASAALAFCATNTTQALVEVQAQGSGVAWILGLWRTGMLPADEVSQ